MEREEFFKLIKSNGFSVSTIKCPFGCTKYFETSPVHDGWSDGYVNNYVLGFSPSMGIHFTIDKVSIGGFTGNQKIQERLFSGVVETEEELNNIFKYIRFKI